MSSAEPFPTLPTTPGPSDKNSPSQAQTSPDVFQPRKRAGSAASNSIRRARNSSASMANSFRQSNPPLGMWQATGEVTSKVPTLGEIRNGSFADDGWSHEGQLERRGTDPHEIQRRRFSRTSSGRTRVSAMSPGSGPLPGHDETAEFFPNMDHTTVAEEAARIPSTIREASRVNTNETYLRSPSQPVEKPVEVVTTTEQPASSSSSTDNRVAGPDEKGRYPNGYRFPKKHTWTQSTVIGLKAFWKFMWTPFGFIITIYGLNVVAWGAMIFFVLLNAAPAMCHPSCNDLQSARKKWIEIDSQVLNGLFCVTGFGLIPWRFRDFYYLMRWRLLKDQDYHRKLAGINRGWYRLPGSDQLEEHVAPPPVYDKKHPRSEDSPPPYPADEMAALEANPAIPIPVTSMPDPPLTGVRAATTKSWNIDIVVWMYFLNTMFQACLAGFMWGMNRFNRPSWATGFFISIGCVVAIAAGVVVFIEGKKVKAIEGIPVHEYDVFEEMEDADNLKQKGQGLAPGIAGEGSGGGEPPGATKSEKIKGRHWYERH